MSPQDENDNVLDEKAVATIACPMCGWQHSVEKAGRTEATIKSMLNRALSHHIKTEHGMQDTKPIVGNIKPLQHGERKLNKPELDSSVNDNSGDEYDNGDDSDDDFDKTGDVTKGEAESTVPVREKQKIPEPPKTLDEQMAEEMQRILQEQLYRVPGADKNVIPWILFQFANNPIYRENPYELFTLLAKKLTKVDDEDIKSIVTSVFKAAEPYLRAKHMRFPDLRFLGTPLVSNRYMQPGSMPFGNIGSGPGGTSTGSEEFRKLSPERPPYGSPYQPNMLPFSQPYQVFDENYVAQKLAHSGQVLTKEEVATLISQTLREYDERRRQEDMIRQMQEQHMREMKEMKDYYEKQIAELKQMIVEANKNKTSSEIELLKASMKEAEEVRKELYERQIKELQEQLKRSEQRLNDLMREFSETIEKLSSELSNDTSGYRTDEAKLLAEALGQVKDVVATNIEENKKTRRMLLNIAEKVMMSNFHPGTQQQLSEEAISEIDKFLKMPDVVSSNKSISDKISNIMDEK